MEISGQSRNDDLQASIAPKFIIPLIFVDPSPDDVYRPFGIVLPGHHSGGLVMLTIHDERFGHNGPYACSYLCVRSLLYIVLKH